MIHVTRLELTYTQLMVLKEAWDYLNPARIANWVDDDDKPITEEWLDQIDELLNNAEFNNWRKR